MESTPPEAGAFRWTFGTAEFDEARWELRVNGQPVDLERKPLDLLLHLLRHAGEVLTKDELLEAVWVGRIVVEAALTNAIGKLRKALGDEAQTWIVSVPRVGYRLTGTVSRKAVPILPPASVLTAGAAVPRRPNFRLVERLARNHEDLEVWRAEQPKTHEVRIFKFSLDGTKLASLKREITLSRVLRDALGERPEFVRVSDWDLDEAPYFIESEDGGRALDQWFVEHGDGFPRAARLTLMAELADAVASAHEVGVLHKDLKPANILVYREGETAAWHPRIADFGSGRVLDPTVLESLAITQMGLTRTQSLASDSLEGTPLYLAPEIVGGQSPSIRSDGYSLGVILFQLLVGDFRRPMSPGWEADIEDPLLRRDISDFANGDPAKRPASVRELATRLRTLDARRLQLDLAQAVEARIAASERKLALTRARRPWMVAAMVLLMVGLAGSLFYAHQAREERATAESNLRTATRLNEFLTQDLIGSANPNSNHGHPVEVGQALDRAEQHLKGRFVGDPLSEGTIRLALAHSYDGLSNPAQSYRQYALAAGLLETAVGFTDPRTLDAELGSAHEAINVGNMKEAKATLDKLEARLNQAKLDLPNVRYEIESGRGVMSERQGDFKAAVLSYQKQLAMLAHLPNTPPEKALKKRTHLGFSLLGYGKTAEGTQMLKETLQAQEHLLGRQHGDTQATRSFYIQALIQNQQLDEALQQTNGLLQDKLAVLGPDSPDIANIHTLKGMIFTQQRQYAAAAMEYGLAKDLFAKTIGPDSPFVSFMTQYRAENLRWAGQSPLAVQILTEQMPTAKKVFGDPTQALSAYAMILAMAELDGHDLAAAQKLLPLVHEHDNTIPSDADDQRKGMLLLLDARVLEAVGDTTGARSRLKESLAASPPKSDYWNEATAHLKAMQ